MTTSTQRQSIVPPEFQAWHDGYHFSPATRVGDTIWVSGQVGIDARGIAGAGIREQAQIAFDSLKRVLETAGATLEDVVELNTFHTDLRIDAQAFAAVKDRYFSQRYPAWTAVGVTQLALPELCVEIRAVAVVGSGTAN